MLSTINSHPRDSRIRFEDKGHKYYINGDGSYTSVTTWVKSHFNKFDADAVIKKMMESQNWENSKYFGMTPEQIKAQWRYTSTKACTQGTKLHSVIEDYYNGKTSDHGSPEYAQFIEFDNDHDYLTPYRTEWKIWDEDLKLSGTVDMLFKKDDGTFVLCDWKNSKEIVISKTYMDFAITDCIAHIPDTNYWHYSLQLNAYKAILERKYGIKISEMILVCFHHTQAKYKKFKVAPMDENMNELLGLITNC